MPHGTTCNANPTGRGDCCARHHGRYTYDVQDQYRYSSESTDANTGRRRLYQRPRSRTLRFANTYDGYDNHDKPLVRYHGSNTESGLARPLIHSFTAMSNAHAVSSLTYSVDPAGGRSFRAEANLEREQCQTCSQWFPNGQKLEYHQEEFPAGCEVHKVCIRMEDVQWHGTSEKHERCFVRGCHSIYRKEGGWKRGVVEGHVRSWHA